MLEALRADGTQTGRACVLLPGLIFAGYMATRSSTCCCSIRFVIVGEGSSPMASLRFLFEIIFQASGRAKRRAECRRWALARRTTAASHFPKLVARNRRSAG